MISGVQATLGIFYCERMLPHNEILINFCGN